MQPGCSPAPITGEQDRPDGGRRVSYQVGDIVVEQSVPPRGFRAASASSDDLQAYGVPARPSAASERADWDATFGRLTGDSFAPVRPCTPDSVPSSAGVAIDFKRNVSDADVAATAPQGSADFSSGNWSGNYVGTTGAGYVRAAYTHVEGYFYQPSFGSTTCSGSAETSWVGLGGLNEKRLLQAGVFSPRAGDPNASAPYPFWEAISPTADDGAQRLASFAVNPGDQIRTRVQYTPSNGTLDVYVYDLASGMYNPTRLYFRDGTYYDGSTGEYIDERPSYFNASVPLRNFVSDLWTGAVATPTGGTFQPFGNLPHQGIVMQNGGHDLAGLTSGNMALPA